MKKSFRIICLVMAIAFAATILFSILFSVTSAQGNDSRGETVYVETDAEGNVRSMISNVYITNSSSKETVTDNTTLTNIKNLLGSEAPTINGQTATFKTEGKDVCYQGTASGTLPFSIKLTYYLNGKKLSPDEIAGKGGRVRIEVECINNLKRTVELDGAQQQLYVPFSVIGMMTLDDGSTALESDAKLSSQAGKTTIMAVMLPGMADDLELSETDRIKDDFYVELNTERFELSQCTFIGMTGIINESDLSGIDDIEELLNALDEIGEASTKLYKGAKRLTDGADTLNGGVSQYVSGVTQAYDGIQQITKGCDQLQNGAGQLAGGAGELASAIGEVVKKVDEAKEKLDELQDPSSDVDEKIIRIAESKLNEALSGKEAELKEKVRQKVYESLADTTLTDEEKKEIADAAAAAVKFEDVELKIDKETANEIRMAVLALEEVQNAIKKLNELVSKADQLSDGADRLASGAGQLSSGIYQLNRGLKELENGLGALSENGTQLTSGTEQLYKGLKSMTSGLRALSREGLSKIIEETDEIQISLSKKDALLELSEGYTSFSCTDENVNGTVQFLITTDAIVEPLPIDMPTPTPLAPSAEGDANNAGTEEQQKGFFEAVSEWFSNAFATVKSWFE